jgi:hypothetical protein
MGYYSDIIINLVKKGDSVTIEERELFEKFIKEIDEKESLGIEYDYFNCKWTSEIQESIVQVFFTKYSNKINIEIIGAGEDPGDTWKITIIDNKLLEYDGYIEYKLTSKNKDKY